MQGIVRILKILKWIYKYITVVYMLIKCPWGNNKNDLNIHGQIIPWLLKISIS